MLAMSIVGALILDSVRVGNAFPAVKAEETVNLGRHQLDLNALEERAGRLRSEKKYEAAIDIYRQILTLREGSLGLYHRDVALTLNNLAVLLFQSGRFAAAEPLYRRALAIQEKVLGDEHLDVASTLSNLAHLLSAEGRYAEAELLYRRSLAIREKMLETDHIDIGYFLIVLANLLQEKGQFEESEPLYRRSIGIYEIRLGREHPAVATILLNLAESLNGQGRYGEAEPLSRRSLAIWEKAHGPAHLDVAEGLNTLAGILGMQGRYGEAESLYRRSLAIRENEHGLEHEEIAASYNNLAGLLQRQGRYEEAEALYRRSLLIWEKIFGFEHRKVALSLNNLAGVLIDQGRFDVAEPLYRRSLAIREKVFKEGHPDVAQSLNNLAKIENWKGRDGEAERLYRRSMAILEKTLGLEHPYLALGLANLAQVLGDRNRYAEAEDLQVRSLQIRQKSLGREHPDVALTLTDLAILSAGRELYDKSVIFLGDSHEIESSWLRRELPFLSDQARTSQLNMRGHAWQLPFGWIEAYPPAADLALEIRVSRHGLVAEIEKRQAVLLGAPGIDRRKLAQLAVLTQQLASVSLPPERRAAARERRDRLRSELYRQNPGLKFEAVTPTEIAKALPSDGVLVEFQRYRSFDGRKPKGQRWGKPQYIALLLKPNGKISAVPLGPAAAIDAKVHKGLAASANNQTDASVIWSQLSEQVLQPLLPQLSGSRQWFLSPDGELNRVPFAALPSPDQPGKSLAQAVQLRLITTGRELLRLQQAVPAGSTPLVMANPSFDRPGAKTVAAVPKDAASTGAQRRSANLSNRRWEPLPATELEGQQVATVLGTRPLGGAAATTTALQRQQGPRVLHVATHGFFVADQDASPTDPLRALQDQAPQLQALRGEDPQLRSGLVLAGANQPDLDPNDDGYLTAAEALLLNLNGTELVVLSACSTGQGEVRTGEGVYGLQRALTVAGARSTLLSLWKVDDAATAEFMVRFYKRLKAGEGRADALAAVQAEFSSGAVKGPSGEDWSPPYYWAAWQLVGDWRPIQGL